MIPLLVVALGAMFSERSGVTNIALEGIMIFGAFAGILVINALGGALQSVPQILFLVGAIVAVIVGVLFSWLHANAAIKYNADQIISATALNLFAPATALFLTMTLELGIRAGSDRLKVNSSQFRIEEVPFLSDIPFIGDILFKNIHLSFYLGIAILVVAYIILYKTKFGLRLRACGENPYAAESAGINVIKTRYAGVLISGGLAGLGGYFLIATMYTEYHASVAGYGFLAMAVMIFGNWKPFRILFAAVFFSVLSVLSNAVALFPALENLEINKSIFKMLPFISTLVILVFMSKSSAAPKASGQPYIRQK
jgi:simple sugar transport system permease protein